jgi:predicted nucleic acid-binding protein
MDHTRQDLSDLAGLALRVVPVRGIFEEAFEVAAAHGIRVCDACYVVAARQLGIEVITGDERLERTLGGTECGVRWLGEPSVSREA